MQTDHSATTATTLDVMHRTETALGAGSNDMAAHFHEDFLWRGNGGCVVKQGLDAFRRNWQTPLRAAFSERKYITKKYLADGDRAACVGHIDALQSGPFTGIAPTGLRERIPDMDFWRIADGRIADNPVSVDFVAVLAQFGRDVFGDEGWEHFDNGVKTPPQPKPPSPEGASA